MSLPKIAVNVAQPNVTAASAPSSGKFSAALAELTNRTPETTVKPTVDTASASNSKGTSDSKDAAKGKTKPGTAPVVDSPVASVLTQTLSKPAVPNLGNLDFFGLPVTVSASPASESSNSVCDSDATSVSEMAPAGMPNSAMTVVSGLGEIFATGTTPGAQADPTSSNASPKQNDASEKLSQASGQELTEGDKPLSVADAKSDDLKSVAPKTNFTIADQSKYLANNTVAPVPVPPTPSADPKPAARKSSSAAIVNDSKPATILGLAPMPHPTYDATQATSTPPAPTQTGNINLGVTQMSRPNQSAAGKSDGGIVPPSTKKDGDAAKNTPPSDKGFSLASAAAATSKATVGDAGVSAIGSGSAVISGGAGNPNPPVVGLTTAATVEVKTLASNAGTKASDLPSNNLKHDVATAMEGPAVAEPSSVSPFQVSRLVERAGQSELRVGIQAGELGSVNIRTSMSHSQLSAEISVDRGELGRAMTAELPNLHNRLAEQRVPVSNIVLQDHSSQNSSAGSQQGSRHNPYGQPIKGMDIDEAQALAPMIAATEASEGGTGLDIHM